MSVGKTLEATILYDVPDGRTVYRPWGRRGPCYLVTSRHRRRFAVYVRVWYGALFIVILVLPFMGGSRAVYVGLAGWLVGSYLFMALLCRGLPRADPPPLPTAEQLNASMARIGLGPRAIRGLFVLSVSMALMGVIVLILGFLWQGLLGALCFGLLAGVYYRRMRQGAA